MDIDDYCMSKLNKILCANKDLGVKLIKAVNNDPTDETINQRNQVNETIQQSYEMLLAIQTLNQIYQEYLEKKNELKEEIDEMIVSDDQFSGYGRSSDVRLRIK